MLLVNVLCSNGWEDREIFWDTPWEIGQAGEVHGSKFQPKKKFGSTNVVGEGEGGFSNNGLNNTPVHVVVVGWSVWTSNVFSFNMECVIWVGGGFLIWSSDL